MKPKKTIIMGLDMYLTKKSYVKNWKHNPEKTYKVTAKLNNKVISHIKPDRVSYVIEDVGYWRKANAIHAWFVNQVQEGKDDCDEYRVEPAQLFELQGICQDIIDVAKVVKGKVRNGYSFNEAGEKVYNLEDGEIVENPEDIATLLPTKEGFFFGSTDYDQWFIQDIKSTLEIIDPILKEVTELKKQDTDYFGMPEFFYRSSW